MARVHSSTIPKSQGVEATQVTAWTNWTRNLHTHPQVHVETEALMGPPKASRPDHSPTTPWK